MKTYMTLSNSTVESVLVDLKHKQQNYHLISTFYISFHKNCYFKIIYE